MERTNTFLRMMYVLFASILVFGIIAMLSFLILSTEPRKAKAEASQHPTSSYSSPNVVADGAEAAVQGMGQTIDSISYSVDSGMRAFASGTVNVSKSIGRGIVAGASATGRGIVRAGTTVGNAIGDGAEFIISAPGNVLGAISEVPVVHNFIRPAEHAEVPIIDPNSPELRAALAALPADEKAKKGAAKGAVIPRWPIHGQITTEFGVNHWPYQDTHTGMDIASGKPLGTLQVHPFRPGTVVDVVYSYYGLGNHVIVDHGSGVTSVYAHLNSISVKKGQRVGQKSLIGYEGTTGLSTGPHLHFEIRVNGMAANPRQFIGGNP